MVWQCGGDPPKFLESFRFLPYRVEKTGDVWYNMAITRLGWKRRYTQMTQKDFFADAVWVGAKSSRPKKFRLFTEISGKGKEVGHAMRFVLGFFKCYINGVCINSDVFWPLCSDYEECANPAGESFRNTELAFRALT